MSKSLKRTADESAGDDIDYFDKFREEISELKESKTPEEYLQLVDELLVFLKSESNSMSSGALAESMRNDATEEFSKHPALVSLIEKLAITKNNYEKIDYRVSSEKTFSFEPFSINVSYVGDDEGSGSYYSSLSNKEGDEVKLLNGGDDIRISRTNKDKLAEFFGAHLKLDDITSEVFDNFVSWVLEDFLNRY